MLGPLTECFDWISTAVELDLEDFHRRPHAVGELARIIEVEDAGEPHRFGADDANQACHVGVVIERLPYLVGSIEFLFAGPHQLLNSSARAISSGLRPGIEVGAAMELLLLH
jgi:hypothetical protein